MWVRADQELQDEDVPVLELGDDFLRTVENTIPKIYNYIKPGRYCFLAKDEHFE